MTTQPTEDELFEYMCEVAEMESAGARAEVAFGPYTALIMIGAIQLAGRNEQVPADMRARFTAIVDQFRPWFAGTLGEHIIDRGNDPRFDREFR